MTEKYIVKFGNFYLRGTVKDKTSQIDVTKDRKEAYPFNTYIQAIVNSERIGGQVMKG